MKEYFGDELKTYEILVGPMQLLNKKVAIRPVTDLSKILARELKEHVPNLVIFEDIRDYNRFVDTHLPNEDVYGVRGFTYAFSRGNKIVAVECIVYMKVEEGKA